MLSILFGCSPEGFFGAYEGTSIRKTRYYKNRKYNKGIIGNILAFVGVIEDHMKGTLHFHLVLIGSISPYVLQELANIQDICDKVATTLDSFYTAKYTTQTNFRNVLTRKLRKLPAINKYVKAEKLSPPALLQRSDPLQQIELIPAGSRECNLETIKQITANERAMVCFHEHHRTCHKGYYGRIRCRLTYKSGLRNGTNCVILQLLSTIDNEDIGEDSVTQMTIVEEEDEFEYDDLFECQSKIYDLSNFNESIIEKKNKENKYAYIVKEISYKNQVKYELKDPLTKKKNSSIV